MPEEQNNPEIERNNTTPYLASKELPKKRTRMWWIKMILLLVLVVLSVVMLFELGGYLSKDTRQLTLPQLLKHINYRRMLLLLGVILLYILIETEKYAYMLKVYTGKFRFKTSFKTMFIGKYYDGITPFGTGGQPFQIYYLHKKHEIPHGAATAIPIVRYLMFSASITILSVVLLCVTPYLNWGSDSVSSTITTTTLIISWVSLGINVLFPTVVVLFSVFPNACKHVIAVIVRILAKLHIVKQKYKTMEKYVREMKEYSTTLRQFGRQIYKFIPVMLLSLCESLLFVTIPFLVVIAVADVPPTTELMMQIACLVIITRYTALLVPTPGNTGAAEAAGSLVFVTVTAASIGSVIGWVLLIWRFLTYYVFILTGIGINVFEIIRSAVRGKKDRKQEL